jgi:hypothetical protein
MTERTSQHIFVKLCSGYCVYMLLMWLLVGFLIKTLDHDLLMLKRVRLESFDS